MFLARKKKPSTAMWTVANNLLLSGTLVSYTSQSCRLCFRPSTGAPRETKVWSLIWMYSNTINIVSLIWTKDKGINSTLKLIRFLLTTAEVWEKGLTAPINCHVSNWPGKFRNLPFPCFCPSHNGSKSLICS